MNANAQKGDLSGQRLGVEKPEGENEQTITNWLKSH